MRHSEGMRTVPFGFLRLIIGVLCIFFAHMLGRAVARVYEGRSRSRSAYGWAIRTLVCALVVTWRAGFDRITIIIYALAVAALLLGFWDQIRPRREEPDLTKEMFPDK